MTGGVGLGCVLLGLVLVLGDHCHLPAADAADGPEDCDDDEDDEFCCPCPSPP